jgi:hypothetical protein
VQSALVIQDRGTEAVFGDSVANLEAFECASGKAPATFSIGAAHFFARRLEKAAATLLVSLQETPNWAPCLRFLASCYAHLGQMRDAQAIVE